MWELGDTQRSASSSVFNYVWWYWDLNYVDLLLIERERKEIMSNK